MDVDDILQAIYLSDEPPQRSDGEMLFSVFAKFNVYAALEASIGHDNMYFTDLVFELILKN